MLRTAFLAAALLAICLPARAEPEWPARIATIEEVEMLTPMRISVPRSRPKGDLRGPVVLRVHVDTEGKVQRVALLESCGSAGHDEAALRSMRSARFAPKLVDGAPVDVTLVVPLHFPMAKPAGQ